MIVNKQYKKELKPFLSRLVNLSKQRHIPNLEQYIKEHKWKLRASGNDIRSKTKVVFLKQFPTFVAHVSNAEKKIEDWLPVLCKYNIIGGGNKRSGELYFDKTVYRFDITYKSEQNYTFTLHEVQNPQLVQLIKRIIYKSAFCINCEGCEVECPTGALYVYPKIKIDKSKCIHCHKCLLFHDQGCIVANSLTMTTSTNTRGGGISKIGTFGIHSEWLQEFLSDPEGFWISNSLGNKQEQSFKAWLIDAELIDQKKILTSFGDFCFKHHENEFDLMWELIWTNLAYGSVLTNWFINTINPEQQFTKALLDELAINVFNGTKNTVTYAIGGFMQIFKYSPIGDFLCQGQSDDGKNYFRGRHEELSEVAFAYSIYKYAASKGIRSLRISDFYVEDCQTGPFKEFAISKLTFTKLLRQLNSASNRILIAELNSGLDSITLREDLNPMNILKQLVL